MKITKTQVKVSDLVKDYSQNNDCGVFSDLIKS